MASTICVTGATGTVGREIIQLLQQNHHVRAAGRKPDRVTTLFGPRVEAVPLDFERPETLAPAFRGVKRLFLMRPPAISNVKKYLWPAIDAALAVGVEHIVFLSLIGAEKNRFVPHHKVEQYIVRSRVSYTFLRPSFYMQNLNTTHRLEIKERNEIYVPAGDGKTSFIDVRDIAAVAEKALTEPGHDNQAYELTGGQALTYAHVAERLSAVLERNIRYCKPSLLRFIRRQQSTGTPLPFVLVMAGIYTTARLGLAARITSDTQHLLGRPPILFDQYAKVYKACWS